MAISNVSKDTPVFTLGGANGTDEIPGSPGTGRGASGGTGAAPPPSGDYGGYGTETPPPMTDEEIEEVNEALEKLKNDPTFRENLLAALGSSGGAEEIAALMVKLSNMSRENVLDQRLQARSAARSDLEASAEQSREAAAKQIAGAIVSFVVATVAAVASLAGSIGSIKNSKEALSQSTQANKLEKGAETARLSGDKAFPEMNETAKNASVTAQHATLAARRSADIGTALSQLTGGLGNLVGGSLDGAAKIDEAQGKEHEASATDQQAQSDVTKKAMDDIEELVKSAIQFLKAMASAEVDLMASMTRV